MQVTPTPETPTATTTAEVISTTGSSQAPTVEFTPTSVPALSVTETVLPTLPPTAEDTISLGQQDSERVAYIYVGSCNADVLSERVAVLNGPSVLEGDVLGSNEAIPVASAFTIIERPFADLLSGSMVLLVSQETNQQLVAACGSIGGVLDESGALSIGLTPVDGSGTVGIAYLSPENQGLATGISIFLIQQPAETPAD